MLRLHGTFKDDARLADADVNQVAQLFDSHITGCAFIRNEKQMVSSAEKQSVDQVFRLIDPPFGPTATKVSAVRGTVANAISQHIEIAAYGSRRRKLVDSCDRVRR